MFASRFFLLVAAIMNISLWGSAASAMEGCDDSFGQDFSHLEPDAASTEVVFGQYRASVAKLRFVSFVRHHETEGAVKRTILGSRALLPTACFLKKSIAAQGVYRVILTAGGSRPFDPELLPSEFSGFDRLPRPEHLSNDTYLSNELTWFGERFTVYCTVPLSPFRKELGGKDCKIRAQIYEGIHIEALVAAGASERPLAWQYEVWPEFTKEDIGQWQARLDELENLVQSLVTLCASAEFLAPSAA